MINCSYRRHQKVPWIYSFKDSCKLVSSFWPVWNTLFSNKIWSFHPLTMMHYNKDQKVVFWGKKIRHWWGIKLGGGNYIYPWKIRCTQLLVQLFWVAIMNLFNFWRRIPLVKIEEEELFPALFFYGIGGYLSSHMLRENDVGISNYVKNRQIY